ncbi:hypothetical protein LJN55_11725 [Erwinia rhapontici]|uniref:hypothetical protein n=1 Tax=Erwinia rhapontici TaxID=55212 RepID=UPI001D0D979E|nr:hypothetical protein [Erwinia rhapontici]UDQ82446.1 hypothetical protein LJN55_11725 [Erwinia rhapontici]
MTSGRSISWSLVIIHVKHHKWTATPLSLAPWQMLIATIPLIFFAIDWRAGIGGLSGYLAIRAVYDRSGSGVRRGEYDRLFRRENPTALLNAIAPELLIFQAKP